MISRLDTNVLEMNISIELVQGECLAEFVGSESILGDFTDVVARRQERKETAFVNS